MAATETAPLLDRADQIVRDGVDDAFAEYFATARRAILGEVTADASPADLPPDLDKWPGSDLWEELMRRFIAPAIEVVFDLAFDNAARSDELQIHRHRQTYMDEVVDRLSAVLWPRDAYERIRGDLAEGMDAGESVDQLRERVAAELQVDQHSYLADRIARTESHTAVEGGTHSASAAWEEVSGQEMYQRWISTADARTRPSHAAASGQTVRVGESFTVGGATLMFPGDPSGPAEETVNCRCSTLSGTRQELDDLGPSAADIQQGAATMTETDAEIYPYPHTPPATGPASESQAPVTWRGILAPLEKRGDFRILGAPQNNAVAVNDRMWLSYQERSSDGHDGKVTVGRIDRAWVHEGDLWGEGPLDVNDATGTTQEVIRKLDEGFAGTVSVDLADGEMELGYYDADDNPVTPPEDIDELMDALDGGTIKELLYVTNWRLGGATLVQDPAFHTARIWLVEPSQGALTAAATGDLELPLADRGRQWDGTAAKRRLQEAERLDEGTFWREEDAEADSDTQADFRLPFADIIDGELRAVPRGIFAVAGVLEGAMGGVDLPSEAQDAIRSRVERYYERMRAEFDDDAIQVPWGDEDESAQADGALTAGGQPSWADQVAAAAPATPPARWFANPELTGLTKVRVTEEGRVYGHIADWNQRHIGAMGEKVYPPRCPNGGSYPRFHRQPVRTAEGTRINTGPLTTAGHASTDTGVTMSAAMAHYDDPRFVVANVVCGEDEHGIWVAGALRPGVEAWQVAFADTYCFSGDWRFNELVAACTVSVEGFFVPADDSVHALAASAGITPEAATVRSRVVQQETVALVSAGVVRPEPSAVRQTQVGMHRIMKLLSQGHDHLAQKMESMPDRVAQVAYEQARQAVRDERELEQMARELNEPLVQQALKDMEECHGM